MARMKTGRRLTPQTTDPQGNRIADPDVFGKKINSNETVSSWPKVREMYQSGKFNDAFKGRALNPEVKNYLEGKTNKLDDKEFEEPILTKTNNGVKEYSDLSTFYRKGGKNYARVEKVTGKKPSTEGQMNYYDTGMTSKNVNDWKSSGAGGGKDLNRYRPKPGEFNPEPKKPEPPKADDLTLDKMPILKPGKIDIKKRIIKAKEKPEPVLFDNPNKAAVVKTKYVHDSSGIRTKAKNPKQEAKEGNINDTTTSRNKIGYKKEERLFKAKASTGAAGTDFTNLDSQDIKYARKNYLKKDLAAARTDATLKPDERAKRIASAKMEIKQSRGAQTYSRKMEKGKLSHFNDENYKGDIIKDYKSSLDNVNNKNTIDAKLKAIGEKAKTKPGSFGSMPTS